MSNISRRQFAVSAASLLWAAGLLATKRVRAQQQPDISFSSDVQVVNLLATVRNKKAEIIRGLNKEVVIEYC